ncbi:hypothetical protein D3C85_1334980 [compost metagenome]
MVSGNQSKLRSNCSSSAQSAFSAALASWGGCSVQGTGSHARRRLPSSLNRWVSFSSMSSASWHWATMLPRSASASSSAARLGVMPTLGCSLNCCMIIPT